MMKEKEILEQEIVEEEIVETKKEVKKETKNELMDNVSKEQVAQEMNLILPKNYTDVIMNTVVNYQQNGQISFPKGYDMPNAIKSAYLTLQTTKDKNGRSFMEVCTKQSIATSLLDMVVQGLDVSKKQAYFIVRGNELTLMRSYFGSQLALKRLPNIKEIWATVIYKGDVIKEEVVEGNRVITEHKTEFGNSDNEIVGAYAIIETIDNEKKYTIMTKKEIDMSWSKSSSSQRLVQKEFGQEMAKRTVINRACKNYVNTEIGFDKYIEAYNRTTDNEFKEENGEPTVIKETKVIEV